MFQTLKTRYDSYISTILSASKYLRYVVEILTALDQYLFGIEKLHAQIEECFIMSCSAQEFGFSLRVNKDDFL